MSVTTPTSPAHRATRRDSTIALAMADVEKEHQGIIGGTVGGSSR